MPKTLRASLWYHVECFQTNIAEEPSLIEPLSVGEDEVIQNRTKSIRSDSSSQR
jgi:hypothetical protein